MKVKINISIDEESLKYVTEESKKQKRTISNMIDFIISEYANHPVRTIVFNSDEGLKIK
jgi:hypothetical protein